MKGFRQRRARPFRRATDLIPARRGGRCYCFPFWILLLIIFLSADTSTVFKPIPAGYIAKEEHFDPDGFQDYTDYCKYRYDSAEAFRRDARYHEITQDEIENVIGYFEDFEEWMRMENRLDEYDFDLSYISAGDFLLLDTKEGSEEFFGDYAKYVDYTVYLFDTDTLTLYYIHNNI